MSILEKGNSTKKSPGWHHYFAIAIIGLVLLWFLFFVVSTVISIFAIVIKVAIVLAVIFVLAKIIL